MPDTPHANDDADEARRIRMDNIAEVTPERYLYVSEPFLRELAALMRINPQDRCPGATPPNKDDRGAP